MDLQTITAAIQDLAVKSMQQVLDDWDMQVGFETELNSSESAMIQDLADWQPNWNQDWTALMRTRIEGQVEGPVHLIFPLDLVFELLREVLGLPQNLERTAGDPLKEIELEAFQEMMNLLCGSFNSTLSELDQTLRVSQSVEHLVISQVEPEVNDADGLPHRGLGVAMTVTHKDKDYQVLEILPVPLARSIAASLA